MVKKKKYIYIYIWLYLLVEMHCSNDLKICRCRMIKNICIFGVRGIYKFFYLW